MYLVACKQNKKTLLHAAYRIRTFQGRPTPKANLRTRYVSSAEDADARLSQHNKVFKTRAETMRYAKFLKSGQRRKLLDTLLDNN